MAGPATADLAERVRGALLLIGSLLILTGAVRSDRAARSRDRPDRTSTRSDQGLGTTRESGTAPWDEEDVLHFCGGIRRKQDVLARMGALAMSHKLIVLLIWLCTICQAEAGPAQVIIIRHAEKPPEGNELSLKGRERAAALVPYFLETPAVLEYQTPVAIYAQGAKKETSSRRPVETVKGLAVALKLQVIDKYTHDEFPQMVGEILAKPEYDGKMVLICWEHRVIPDIARRFGAKDAPGTWHDDVFDRTWLITFKPSGKAVFKDLPQKLMYGDSSE